MRLTPDSQEEDPIEFEEALALAQERTSLIVRDAPGRLRDAKLTPPDKKGPSGRPHARAIRRIEYERRLFRASLGMVAASLPRRERSPSRLKRG